MHPGKGKSKEPRASGASGEFLHHSVSEALRRRLAEGRLAGGSKLPALKELAGELSVSTMTVRRALRTLEHEGHVYSIAGVGSFVRPAASAAILRKIAFVGSDLTSPFQMAIARGAQRASQKTGWSVALLDAHWDVELESANIRGLPEMGARGALLLPPFSADKTAAALLALQTDNFPMVLVDMAAPGLRADIVSSDHEAGAQMATRYLIDQGHRRVLMLTHPPVSSSVVARIAGYEQGLRLAGIEPRPEWKAWIDLSVHLAGYRDGRIWWGGCQAILPLLRQFRGPLAVLAVDAYTGWGIYEACRQLGLRIPDDVSVIAFDDFDIAHAVSPRMTIVSQRTDEIGRVAVELLERRMQTQPRLEPGHRQITQILIDADLIKRESVSCVR